MSEFTEELRSLFDACSYPLSDAQMLQMEQYYNCLLRENAKYNITTIAQPKEAALKHFLDSVVPCAELPANACVIDVGSGGGFPAAPITVLRPDVQMHALEATGKKCAFITMAAQEAGIQLQTLQARAEEAAQQPQWREKYDVCVSRAVADLPILMELCAGFVKQGGLFMAYKSSSVKEEMQRAANAMETLGLKFEKQLHLPLEEYDHNVLIYKKNKPIPEKYPRNNAQIRKRPL